MDEHLFPVDAVKRCCTCKQVKPLEEFNKRTAATDGRQPSCRECNKAYHYAHLERHLAQIKRRHRRIRAENRERMIEYLRSHPCVDCGESDILVLEFDHLRDKAWNVGAMISHNCEWARILEEIAKCEVVCASCHRRRTARRANTYRFRASQQDRERWWAAWESDPDRTD
jgi:hypothetical protein